MHDDASVDRPFEITLYPCFHTEMLNGGSMHKVADQPHNICDIWTSDCKICKFTNKPLIITCVVKSFLIHGQLEFTINKRCGRFAIKYLSLLEKVNYIFSLVQK